MTPEIKKLWLEALRSGEYQQTTGQLCKADPETGERAGFCCLGVLLDVAKGSDVWVQETSENIKGCEYIHAGVMQKYYDCESEEFIEGMDTLEEGELPYEYQLEFELKSEDCETLMMLNDGSERSPGVGFDNIADWIEENL